MIFINIDWIDVKFFQFLILAYMPNKLNVNQFSSQMNICVNRLNLKLTKDRSLYSFLNFEFYFLQKKINKKYSFVDYQLDSGVNLKKKKNMGKKILFNDLNKHKVYKSSYKIIKSKFTALTHQPFVRYVDFAGINRIIFRIQESIEWPFRYFKIYQKLNIFPARGILLYGQPGTGKTFLAYVIAGELNIPILSLSASSIISSVSGKSEKKIREIFNYAKKIAPCIVFFDEIDVIGQSREYSSKDLDKKILGELLISLDNIKMRKKNPIFIIAATNQVENLDKALRRPGRFDYEIKLSIPNVEERNLLLIHFTKNLFLSKDIDLKEIAKKTIAFVSGDISALIKNVIITSLFRIYANVFKSSYFMKEIIFLTNFTISKIDFNNAFSKTEPSLLRHGFSIKHEVYWDQVGALNLIRMVMSKYVIEPIKNSFGMNFIKNKGIGILLYGPPGCGKTLIAQATASEAEANYIGVKGPEILDKFLGESEKTIRLIFNKARLCAPTIIFFDELDSIASKRSESYSSFQNVASDRIVNQLLTEIDGIEKKEQIYIIGATNRPDNIDKAMLRPGRIDKLLYVPLPKKREKIYIIRAITKKIFVLPFLDLKFLSKFIPNSYSGADLMACTREAIINNLNSQIKYIFFEMASDGLFIVSKNCISTKDYIIGIKNINNSIILKKKN